MVESPILGQQQPQQVAPQENKTVGTSRNDYVPETGMGGTTGVGSTEGGGEMISGMGTTTSGGGSAMAMGGYNPQLQTLESVDRQLTQGFGTPLNPSEQPYFQQQQQQPLGMSGREMGRAQNDYAPQSAMMEGESSNVPMASSTMTQQPPLEMSGSEMGRAQNDYAPQSNVPMASSAMTGNVPPPPMFTTTGESIMPSSGPTTMTTTGMSPQQQPLQQQPPSSGMTPQQIPLGSGATMGVVGSGMTGSPPHSPIRERKLIVCSNQPSEELLETHLRGGRVTVPPGNYEDNVPGGGGGGGSMEMQQQPISSSTTTTRPYASPSLLSTIPPQASDLSHMQPQTQFQEQSRAKPYSSIFEPPSMRAVITCDYNNEEPERAFMYLDKYPQPCAHRLNPGEVIVKMKYASMNAFDCKINQGKIPIEIASSSRTYWRQYPMIGGHDGAGVIYKFAERSTTTGQSQQPSQQQQQQQPSQHYTGTSMFGFRVGDPVLGFTSNAQFGTFGEYAIFNERDLVMKPENMSWEEAACIPYSALTAMNCFLKADKKRKKRKAHGPSTAKPTTTSMSMMGTATMAPSGTTGTTTDMSGGMGSSSTMMMREPIDQNTVHSLVNGDKFGSVFIHGGNTSVGIWCILLAKHYFGAQRIYTTICSGTMEDEELLKRLGADVVINCTSTTTTGTTTGGGGGMEGSSSAGTSLSTNLNNYDELINKDLQQYWVEFLGELERQATPPTMTTTTMMMGGTSVPTKQTPLETTTTTTTQQAVSQQPSTQGTTTIEGITESTTVSQQQQQPIQVEPTTQTQQQLVPPQTSSASGELSPRGSTSWPHKGFKSRKDMDKCKNLVGSLELAIDTVGGHDVMNKCFGLLSGSHSHFVTLCPSVELEQRKVSGKDVWKMVSMTATNRIKSFFANYPHFHIIIHVESDKELLQEAVDWYSEVKNEPFMRQAIRHKIYDLRECAACMQDLREKKFSSHKLLLDMSY
ncbi:hypothetical protein C9374_005973 [Naegleria lovaniensis]|uniref:Enoyl reductase (ER) domain-containing protein n=1 Tax=Naegleria lovaniensis TaxID=51637 RepID=A0AA88KHB2_NAELO|nr:uncharacterized protein C9374_005973 [Naegleria lovaniensis]KAG2381589.1 hypothetical protein C9374_005973 [Naegleria lovaniensis]